jgi:tetratricopeptide (TPR) repeat protein
VLTINVIGRFRVVRSDGAEITPRGRKTCGLLALLALAPRKSRTRLWLQDKLWSDRGAEQAAASLRQCLCEIRQAFGADRAALLSDMPAIGLDPNMVTIDIDNLPQGLSALAGTAGTPELLEGFDVRDQEFEDWLRVARQSFEKETAALCAEPAVPADEADARPARPRLIITTDAACPATDRALAGFLAHRVAQGISEAASVRVQPADGATEAVEASAGVYGLEIRTAALRAGRETALRVSLCSEDGREVLWSIVRAVPEFADHTIDHPTAQHLCNQAVDAAVEIIRRARPDAPKPAAAHLALDAVRRIFTLRQAELEEADRLLVRAQEIDARGIYPAWRAFLRTILVGERRPVPVDDLRLESEALVRQALEREPNNSNVYALAAQVNYLTLYNSEAAMMLAETSLALNPTNPLAHAHFGTASADAGVGDRGYRHALAAVAIAGNGPYRYWILNHCCVAAILTGRYREAIHYAECAHTLAPDFLPPIRYLAALYFHSGNLEKAVRFVRELKRHEPDFTVDLLRDEQYPATTLRRTPLIEIADAHGLVD